MKKILFLTLNILLLVLNATLAHANMPKEMPNDFQLSYEYKSLSAIPETNLTIHISEKKCEYHCVISKWRKKLNRDVILKKTDKTAIISPDNLRELYKVFYTNHFDTLNGEEVYYITDSPFERLTISWNNGKFFYILNASQIVNLEHRKLQHNIDQAFEKIIHQLGWND